MKNLYHLLLCAVLAMMSSATWAQTFTVDDLTFTVTDADAKTVSVKKTAATTGDLVIPSSVTNIGTAAFALLFGIDREHYVPAGVIGAIGWALYLILIRNCGATPVVATLAASTLVCIVSRMAAIPYRIPAQGFLLCGIFPLVPGAGVFWFTYYFTDSQFDLSMQSGLLAGKVAIAIVLGIILAMELPQRLFSHNHRTH